MQSSVKDRYILAQSRMMYSGYTFYSLLGIGLMGAEVYLVNNPDPVISQILTIMSVVAALLFILLSMLIVEVMYQDELHHIPLIASLERLTPELNWVQRYSFLSISIKRQITSTISLVAFWIGFGGSPRGVSLVFGMAMITVLTAYGLSYTRGLQPVTTSTHTLHNKLNETTQDFKSL